VSDGFEVLRAEHREVGELFDRYQASPDDRLAHTIFTELTLHTEAEERALYPELRRLVDGGDDMADEAEAEHGAVKALIARAYDSPPPDLAPLVQSVRNDVEAHVRREEAETFPAMREAGVDAAQLAERLQSAKRELEARGTHSA
jgi:iron-sulfur cluster repair protein YtfE (RIC family)